MDQRIPEGEVPEEIRIVNEFLNTVDLHRFGDASGMPESEREIFRTTSDLQAWLEERDLLDHGETVTEGDRQLAITIRTALREAARLNNRNDKHQIDPQLRTRANEALTGLPLVVQLGEDGVPRLVPGQRDAAGALARILADVAVAISRGTWKRLKLCRAEDCLWAYFDHSRSRTGRWCSMTTCGNRLKTRRYRARRQHHSNDSG